MKKLQNVETVERENYTLVNKRYGLLIVNKNIRKDRHTRFVSNTS